ncbi:hypothetical protein CAV_0199 [Campylobacter avium LMG 24591]|uniref:NADH dehydrogenase I subunit F n=2 Tax=Campylobacter avium TaxID=522485 RepID=A0A222MVN9_9BACT|nr:hypothetical protein CAV_0199 [Campylobacter avium LMG 24591]OYD78970.1 hypothetical protein CAV8706_0201 [Campylobacter avium]
MKLHRYEPCKKALCILDMPSINHKELFKDLNTEENFYISCIKDKAFKAKFFKCEIASISFVLALLAKFACDDFSHFDEGFLSAESCVGEEEISEILAFLKEAEFIVFDENLKHHQDYENIKFFLSFLARKFDLKLTCSNQKEDELKPCEFKGLQDLQNYDGLVVFKALLDDGFLHCSRQFLTLCKLNDKDEICINFEGKSINTKIILDENLQGTIAFLNFKDEGFAFKKVSVKRL